ncbi:pseudaminic acid synthase [Oceaniserpentilla sp. 4NH20-0058]|uniref:pseudaminic acid synthase n=1 Tax=Oceaniserpentilla sp. 4NH20-0058 TaxID=3127660 RepID=UPI0031064FB9
MQTIDINGVKIGNGYAPYVVAEISANHNGDIERAKRIMLAAKTSGAHAVKMQTYTPDTITLNSDKADFRIDSGPWQGQTLYQLYSEAYTPFEWHKPLFDYAHSIDLTCFSTPFDESAVDLLEDLNAPAYKIASFEAIDLPLIQYVARTKKPMIISTGMANLTEIEEAVEAARSAGCHDLILLHCISSYPAPIEQSNLNTIPDLAKRFNVQVGLSDHTLGYTASVVAAALGAVFIEKHFTLSRNDKGPDSDFSLEPSELEQLCKSTRDAWLALGVAGYERKQAENENVRFRRSIYASKDIKKGEVLTSGNIKRVRPGFGLPPKYFDQIVGQVASEDIEFGSPIDFKIIKHK